MDINYILFFGVGIEFFISFGNFDALCKEVDIMNILLVFNDVKI